MIMKEVEESDNEDEVKLLEQDKLSDFEWLCFKTPYWF